MCQPQVISGVCTVHVCGIIACVSLLEGCQYFPSSLIDLDRISTFLFILLE